MMTARITCRAHCATCGRHFASTRAFDLHRAGDHAAGTRHCLSPSVDTDRLELLADDGWCKISGEHDDGVPRTLHPITVWRERLSVKQQAAIARLTNERARSRESTASEW